MAIISVLTQERLLGAFLGSCFMGFYIIQQRRGIYSSVSDGKTLENDLLEGGSKNSSNFAHLWNKTVDMSLGSLVAFLGSRGL